MGAFGIGQPLNRFEDERLLRRGRVRRGSGSSRSGLRLFPAVAPCAYCDRDDRT
jgi:hypothetical protein